MYLLKIYIIYVLSLTLPCSTAMSVLFCLNKDIKILL